MMGAMLLGMLDVGYAQQQRYERPDFKLCFDILRKNRAIYNKYNDSILIKIRHAEILRHAMRCLMLFIDLIMPWTLATHL